MDLHVETVPTHGVADIFLIARAQQVLADAYPGYSWIVGLNDESLGGVMTIMNLEVNTQLLGAPNWGFVLKLSRIYADPSLKCVIMAGGAILESANLLRGRNIDQTIKNIDGVDHRKFPLIGISHD